MLYCPKCQRTYNEAAQRFCLNDGARLLPAPSSGKSANQTGGVFSKILNRKPQASEADGNQANSYPSFSPPAGKMFRAEEDILSLPEIKPLPRAIKTSEVPASQATLGDRKINPTGRPALSWENPNVLLQQTIKNRYLITKKIEQDSGSIAYLAEDKLVAGKKVLIRILMETDAGDKFANKIFAEERVSLSHVNHPNVASVIDSGELLEGNPFIITEYVEGTSVKDMLNRKGEFNALRTARIVRQVSYALSEVHQNGILHRNLKPENIILMLNEDGAEQVKLINFGVPNEKLNGENLTYKSPEQLEGNIATFASDLYSLAVVAYQMLTNRLPFNASSASALLKLQREGIIARPTNLRSDLTPGVDVIFEKAFAFSPTERYPKSRDFGDAFYNALASAAAQREKEEKQSETQEIDLLPQGKIEENVRKAISQPTEILFSMPPLELVDNGAATGDFELEIPPLETDSVMPPVLLTEVIAETPVNVNSSIDVNFPVIVDSPVSDDSAVMAENFIEKAEVKAPKDPSWEKRSPHPPVVASTNKTLLSLFSIALILLGTFGVWYYLWTRQNANQIAEKPTQIVNAATPVALNSPPENLNAAPKQTPPPADIEVPPPARLIMQPPNTIFFETNKQNLKGDLLRNFVGFSLYYPRDWIKNDAENNFIDIARKSADGKPIEQMLISYYDSRGTFSTDRENFTKLAEKSDRDLAKIIPNYQAMFAGETKVNGDWRGYEVKFQGGGKVEKGEKNLIIWGRRIWIPAARPGTKNGFVVTMLATSLSPEIGSVDDVGVKGDLGTVFGTFEPNQNF